MDNQFVRTLSGYAPIILILLSVAGVLTGGLVLSRWDYSLRGLAVAIPFIIAAVLLRSLYSASPDVADTSPRQWTARVNFSLIFVIVYLTSLVVLLLRAGREWYLGAIILLYVVLFLKVFFTRVNVHVVLAQIILIMVNIIYGVTFYYPLFFRTTDVMVHIYLATITFLSGRVIPLDIDPGYSPFPLYHVFIAECSSILGLPVQATLFLVTCPVYVIIILFIYKIFSMISGNPRAAVLGCLFFSMSEVVLTRGIEMVTSVTAFVGFFILLYLIMRSGERIEHRRTFQALALIVALFTILVHQVSIYLIVALLITLILSETIINGKRIFTNYFVVFIIALLSSYWVYAATFFLYQVLSPRLNPEIVNLEAKETFVSDPSLGQTTIALIYLYNNIALSILAVFAITGVFYMIWRQKPRYLAVLGIFLLITLFLYLPNPLSTTYLFTELLRIDRFHILLSPFVAFAMGYGFILTHTILIQRGARQPLVSIISILVVIAFIITSVPGVILTESSEAKLFFDSQELEGFAFVLHDVPYGSELNSDYYTARFFIQRHFTLTDQLMLPHYQSGLLKGFDDKSVEPGYSIIRNDMFREYGLRIERNRTEIKYLPTEQNRGEVENFVDMMNKIYYSDSITIVH